MRNYFFGSRSVGSRSVMVRMGMATLALTGIVSQAAVAAQLYWSGTGTWDTTTTNWGTAPGGPYDQATWSNTTPDSATFEGTAGTVTLGTPITAAGVTFGLDGYTLDSSTLTLSTTGTGITATGSATIDSAVALSGNQSWSVASGETLTLGGVVSGTSTLTYGGSGTYEVNGVNTNSGNITINAATVSVADGGTLYGSGLGWSLRTVTLSNGGTLVATNFSNGAGNLWGQIGDGSNNIIFGTGGGTFRMTGAVMNSGVNKGFSVNSGATGVFEVPTGVDSSWGGSYSGRDFQVGSGGTLEFDIEGTFSTSRLIQGSGAVRKAGAGTLTLTGGNSYSGATTIAAGTLAIGTGGLLSASTAIGIDNGGTLRLDRGDVWGSHNATTSSPITIASGGTLDSRNFNTVVSPTLNGGQIVLNGGASASYPSLSLKGTLTVGGSSASSINVGTGSNNAINIGPTDAAGVLTVNVADATGSDAVDLTINPVLQNTQNTGGTGTLASGLTKTGAGTLAATAANTFSGGLVINAGTFQAANATTGSNSAVGAAANAITVNAGGRLQFTANRGAGFHTGSVAVNGGTISFTSSDNSLASGNTVTLDTAAGTIDGAGQWRFRGGATLRVLAAADGSTLSTSDVNFTEGNQTFNIDTGATLTVSSGFTTLTSGVYNKAGGGTMAITTVQSNYGGSVTVNAGTLDIAVGTSGGTASGLGSGSNSVAVGTAATLLFSGGSRTAGYHNGTVTVNSGTITFNTLDNSFANGRTVTLDVGPGTINGTGQWLRREANNRVAVTAAASGSVISVADLYLLDNSPAFDVADGAQTNDLTISGGITGGATLTKTGTGTLAVTGSNTLFSGATAINAGTLVVGSSTALGTSGSITIGAASTLGIGAGVAFSRPLTITTGGRVDLGAGASVALPSVASLAAFQSTSTAGAATTARILFGSGSTTPTALTSDWVAKPSAEYFSDILSLEGTGTGNTYVLSLAYDNSVTNPAALNISYRSGTSGPFTPVGTSSQGTTAWSSSFTTVGQYGVDTTAGTVWVVTDHNSQFVIVPEPAFGLVVAGAVAAAAIIRARRRSHG